jgi:uncharacterized membrane protein
MRAVCHPRAAPPHGPTDVRDHASVTVDPAHPGPHAPQSGGAVAHVRAVIGGLLILTLLMLVPDVSLPAQQVTSNLLHGRIVTIDAADPVSGQQSAEVEILDGPRAGERVSADLGGVVTAIPGGGGGAGAPSGSDAPSGSGAPSGSDAPAPSASPAAITMPFAAGDEVVLQVTSSPDGEFIAVSDRWRGPLLGGVLAAFALLVVLVAGWRGIRALVALALTVGVVIKVLLPLLIAGWDPVLLAVVTGSGVTVVTLLLTEGWRRSTLAAAVGTFAALVVTAVIAALVTGAARFSVLQGSEDVGFLQAITGLNTDLGGLLLASVILGALGVLDDVTVTQAVTVEELASADPTASRALLAGRAMTIGRAHIAATVNTLVLAYVGASLPLLLLFALSKQPLLALASTENVAVEIVRAIVGSMGIVLAVPFTTFVATRLVPRDRVAAHRRPVTPTPGGPATADATADRGSALVDRPIARRPGDRGRPLAPGRAMARPIDPERDLPRRPLTDDVPTRDPGPPSDGPAD